MQFKWKELNERPYTKCICIFTLKLKKEQSKAKGKRNRKEGKKCGKKEGNATNRVEKLKFMRFLS